MSCGESPVDLGLRVLSVALSIVVFAAGAVRADDAALLDLLRDKKILNAKEYERVKGTELTPAQRNELLEVLQQKKLLTREEAARVESAPALQPTPTVAVVAEKSPAADKPAAAPQVGYEEGFFVKSADGNFNLKLNGRAVTQFRFEEPDTSLNNDITLDRARMMMEGTFYKYFRARVEGEFAGSASLRDGWFALQPMPEVNFQIGQFVVPFGYELLVSKLRSDFVERSAVANQTVSPRRDIGLMLFGQLLEKRIQYNLAVMNGAGQNRGDNNADKDIVARLALSPFLTSDIPHMKGLNVGGSMTYGHQPLESTRDASGMTQLTRNSISGATEAGFNFYSAVPRRGARTRAGAHVAWFDGPFSLSTEYIQTNEERKNLGSAGEDLPDLDTDGAFVSGTWLITGEEKVYNKRVRPARPLWFGPNAGWGAWEAALRYEYFKLSHGADSPTVSAVDNRYDAFLAGLNWYPNELMRFSLNYVYSTYGEQGTGKSPNPDKRSNNVVLGRAQLDF